MTTSQNQSAQDSGQQIKLTHRLTNSDMSSPSAMVDNVTDTTSKAIAVLKLITLGIDTGNSETDGIQYDAIGTVIDLLNDIDAIVLAHAKEVGGAQ